MSMANVAKLLLLLLLAGCTGTAATHGAGFSYLSPSKETRNYILANDRPFAEQIAGNNRTCLRSTACEKPTN